MFFVLVAKQTNFPPASFASKRKLCYNRDKKHIYTGKDRISHGTKRWLQQDVYKRQVESRLDAIGKEKGVTFDYADYYANAQADQSNLCLLYTSRCV